MMLPSNPGPIGVFDSGYGGLTILHGLVWKGFFLVRDGLAAYQLVGGVMAYQGFDG